MEIREKSKKSSIIKNIIVLAITFIISMGIISSFRDTIDTSEITEYETNLDKITGEVNTIENKILTTQKSVEELEGFIDENSN